MESYIDQLVTSNGYPEGSYIDRLVTSNGYPEELYIDRLVKSNDYRAGSYIDQLATSNKSILLIDEYAQLIVFVRGSVYSINLFYQFQKTNAPQIPQAASSDFQFSSILFKKNVKFSTFQFVTLCVFFYCEIKKY